MLLSVIIPCYNSADCIEPLLCCLENQTIGIENLEIIFVDDNSLDDTCKKLKEYQKRHPQNVLIIENEKNYGVSYSRNLGMQKSHTPYVTYADHDDVLEKELYETLYKGMLQYDCEIAMCAHDYITEEERNAEDVSGGPVNEGKLYYLHNNAARKEFMMQFRNDLECWSKLIRKEFLSEHNIFFPEGMWGEDFYWWSLIEMNLNSLCWIPRVLYHHIRNVGAISSKEMHNWMSAQILLNHEAKRRGIYQEFSEVLDLEMYEVGFASTLYYWILQKEFSVQELEELRRVTVKETNDLFHNTYVRSRNFRYRYSEYALELLRGEITADGISNFLKSIINALQTIQGE